MTTEAHVEEAKDRVGADFSGATVQVWQRRRFLGRIVTSIHTVIAAIVGTLVGGAVASPTFNRRRTNWATAGRLSQLTLNVPVPVEISVSREDGYREVVEPQSLFLVRTSDVHALALDSTCTHLGCRVSWDPMTQELKCPCHGGIYTATGEVKSGPPPEPLRRIAARIEGDEIRVRV